MSTALTEFKGNEANLSPAQRTALTSLIESLTQSNEFIEAGEEETSRINIPTLKLQQNTTSDPNCPANSKPGNLYLPGLVLEQPVGAVVLSIWNSRIMWEDQNSSTIVCSSVDGIHGSPKGILCKDCPESQWGTEPGSTKPTIPPGCTEVINAVMILEDLSSMFQVRFSKTSFKAGVLLKKAAAANSSAVFNLSSTTKQSGRTTYYILETRPAGRRADPGILEIQKHLASVIKNSRENFKSIMKKKWEELGGGTTGLKAISEPKVNVTQLSNSSDPEFDKDL